MRKNGQLTEACELAEQLLVNKPDDLFNRRAAAWVYIDFLKLHGVFKEETLSKLEKLCALGFDASEKILWEQLYWIVAKAVFKLTDETPSALLQRFETCWLTFATVPSQAYSVLLKALVKQALKWKQFSAMVASWGLEHFQTSDFENETLQNGKGVPSLVERTYLAVSKAYLIQPYADASMSDFLQQLNTVSEAHPEMLYLIYYRALLYHKLGRLDDALALFIPFARKKRRDFWVWDLLAQLHPHDHALQMACWAKALTCKTPPEFLVKIRQKMAGVLIESGRWEEAKVEIEVLCRVREANHWRVPKEVEAWQHDPLYPRSTQNKSNDNIYTLWTKQAEQLLVEELPERLGVVWSVNLEKKTAQYFVDEHTFGGFGYEKYGLPEPLVGQFLQLSLKEVKAAEGHFWQVHRVETYQGRTPLEGLVRSFEGMLQMKGNVGFVKGVMVHVSQINFDIDTKTLVKGMAVRAYNQKNKEWGWRAIDIEKLFIFEN